ncbi:MAG: sensor domain-containing diguanylate cyclase, partial [Spirochaetales bacterium]|nr:sensor domain-containing diguanylate cyclase [Spirochaetales bacterium]
TKPYIWKDEEIALLRMAAHLISTAVLHNRLNSTNRQFEILSGLTESSAWELDINTGYCWFDSKIISTTKGLSDNYHQPLPQVLRYIHPDDLKETFSNLRNRLNNGDSTLRQDLRILRDNRYVWSEVIARISRDCEGQMEKVAGIIIDIPGRKKKEEELYRKATQDPLTGIANRGSFDDRFRLMIHRLQNEGIPFSLLMLDIDHFKKVNDTWGHDIGDQALKHMTRIVQGTLREGEFAARFGGEEFAVLLQNDSPVASETIAERIRSSVEGSPLVTEGHTIHMTLSIGVFNATEEHTDLDYTAILNKADGALYKAKKSGRNRVVSSQG